MNMGKEAELELNHKESESKNLVNVTLLGICFTIFTFILSIRPELLTKNYIIAVQLICSIPFLMSAILARSKSSYTIGVHKMQTFGYFTYVLGYTFLLNVIGLLTIYFISIQIGLIFFAVNILAALSYSVVSIVDGKSTWKRRLIKDLAFITIILILGVLPAFGYITFS